MDVFKIIEVDASNEEKSKGVCIGIEVTVAGNRLPCPVSDICHTSGDLEREIKKIQDSLDTLYEKGKTFLTTSAMTSSLNITPETLPDEAWVRLGHIKEDSTFAETFNSLDEEKRKEIAEYVLTQCNIFSGKGAFFSQCYDSESGYMEV